VSKKLNTFRYHHYYWPSGGEAILENLLPYWRAPVFSSELSRLFHHIVPSARQQKDGAINSCRMLNKSVTILPCIIEKSSVSKAVKIQFEVVGIMNDKPLFGCFLWRQNSLGLIWIRILFNEHHEIQLGMVHALY